jgi:hypothetical protein
VVIAARPVSALFPAHVKSFYMTRNRASMVAATRVSLVSRASDKGVYARLRRAMARSTVLIVKISINGKCAATRWSVKATAGAAAAPALTDGARCRPGFP